MAYIVLLKKSAEKELKLLPQKTHDRIVERLLSLKENARPASAKKLRGGKGHRIRVGDYRILYVIDDAKRIIEIYSVAHRREAYR